jgi:hypothetical protein
MGSQTVTNPSKLPSNLLSLLMMHSYRPLPLNLLNTPLEISSSKVMPTTASRNKQWRISKQIIHFLQRTTGRLGKHGPEEEGVGKVAHDENNVPTPSDGFDGYCGGLTDHGVKGKGYHGRDGHAF